MSDPSHLQLSSALSIKAEVMQWVYTSGTTHPPRRHQAQVTQQNRKAVSSGFFSSLFSGIAGFNSPQRSSTPNPEVVSKQPSDAEEANKRRKLLIITETSVVLAVYSASVDVHLDGNLRQELLNATKKNAPTKTRYELIYVSPPLSLSDNQC
jgi:hypothetical protein